MSKSEYLIQIEKLQKKYRIILKMMEGCETKREVEAYEQGLEEINKEIEELEQRMAND